MNKKYTVVYSDIVLKKLKKMDRGSSIRIISWISKNLEQTTTPRANGKALSGNFKNAWRYRVGNYRVVAEIDDEKIIILVLNIGHRDNVYK